MGTLVRYFRQHRWQRRAVTFLIAVVAGAAVAMFLWPTIGEYLILRQLGSASPGARDRAIRQAVVMAQRSPSFVGRLDEALDTDDDVKFASLVAVLRRLGKFNTPGRDGAQIDRIGAIDIAHTPSTQPDDEAARTRRILLVRIILAGRGNAYVRRAMELTCRDDSLVVRALAPLLAGRLGEDETLAKLMDDADPSVTAAAALSAGIAGRQALAPKLRELLVSAGDVEVRSAAAYGLAQLDTPGSAGLLAAALSQAQRDGQADLRDRLLHVLGAMDGDKAASAVTGVIERAQQAGRFPPAMAILAAGKLKLASAGPIIRDSLAELAEGNGDYDEGDVLAMLAAAEMLDVPVRAQLYSLCEKLWNPHEYQLILARAAGLLGRQAATDQDDDAPAREECVHLLQHLALYSASPASQPAGQEPITWTTPVPSAAAAVALWMLDPSATIFKSPPQLDDSGVLDLEIDRDSSALYIHQAAGAATTLPGEYIAWHLGRSGNALAFELGLAMLPPPLDPTRPLNDQPMRVYNKNERSAGAMLLALAAGTESQKLRARQRIVFRLEGGAFGPEEDFFVAGAYRCALLILGQREQAATVRELLAVPDFPQRRTLTALLAVGDRDALDWLLWGGDADQAGIAFLLIGKGIGEVLSVMAPALPAVDACASVQLQRWQVRILQSTYAIRRNAISLGLAAVDAGSDR